MKKVTFFDDSKILDMKVRCSTKAGGSCDNFKAGMIMAWLADHDISVKATELGFDDMVDYDYILTISQLTELYKFLEDKGTSDPVLVV